MEELLKELESAYRIVSNIPVTGDSVDMMAAARAKLRKVYSAMQEKAANDAKHKGGEDNG